MSAIHFIPYRKISIILVPPVKDVQVSEFTCVKFSVPDFLQVMAVAGLDSSRAHRLSPTRSTRSWATPPATPASKDQSPYYTPLIRVDHPHRESIASSQVSVRKSSWYTDDPEFSQRMYSPVHLQVPPEYHNQYHQKRGSATSLVEAVGCEAMGGVFA